MNKITFALLSAAMFSTFAKADFYAGAQLGGSFTQGKIVAPNQLSCGVGPNFLGGLIFGYDYISDSGFYLALEWNLLYHNLNNALNSVDTNGTKTDTITIKNNFLAGGAAQFGYQIADNLIPFISLGGVMGQYNISVKDGSASLEDKKNVFNITPGFGFKYNADQWVAGVQYKYFIVPTLQPKDYLATFKLREHIITASVAYRF